MSQKIKTGKIPNNVGFPAGMQGTNNRAVTRQHTAADDGKKFTDNFGREYTYTTKGLIY